MARFQHSTTGRGREEQSVCDPGAVSCFYLPFVGIAIVQASRAEINQIKTI
jgi:hypothetical protein